MSDDMRKAAQGLLDHQREMQAVMRRYLKPGSGMTATGFADHIIELLDGPRQREVTARAEAVIARGNMHSISAGTKKPGA